MQLWTEKYAPKTMNDFAGNREVVSMISKFSEDLPHLLFLGADGSGKRTLAKILAKSFLKDMFLENYLFVDLSRVSRNSLFKSRDDWSYSEKNWAEKMNVVSVKDFALSLPLSAPFRIIVLSGIQYLDFLSQQALRVIIEKSSRFSRFILIGKSKSKLIMPIVSRVAEFHFSALEFNDFSKILDNILKKENIVFDKRIIPFLFLKTNADLFKAITILQSLNEYSFDFVKMNFFQKPEFKELFELIITQNYKGIRKKIQSLLYYDAYEPREIIKQLMYYVETSDLSVEQKVKIIEKIASLEPELNAYDPFIALESILMGIFK